MADNARGTLVIIGGAEDKKGDKKILRFVSDIAAQTGGLLAVITTATEKPEEVGETYRGIFNELGFQNVDCLNLNSRDDAENDNISDVIGRAGGIFFTGGDQLRITSILGGTKAHRALLSAYHNGVVIAGTSAGASVMSSTMVVDGNDNGPARKCTLKMAPGFGFLEGAIIDQHFAQRGRIGRLLCGVAENPSVLGIGIDENTAIVVKPDRHFEVIGDNSVTVVDGKSIKSSNVSELKPDEILAIANVTLHVLTAGYGFDMEERSVLRLH